MSEFIREATPPVGCSSRNSYAGIDPNNQVKTKATAAVAVVLLIWQYVECLFLFIWLVFSIFLNLLLKKVCIRINSLAFCIF